MSVSAKKRNGKHDRSRRTAGILLTLPALLVMAATVLYPILSSFKLSIYESQGMMSTGAFVGLDNYWKVLQSSQFQSSLRNTFGFVSVTIIVELIIGFAVALVLNRSLPGTKFFRIIFTLPLMIAPVVSGLQWRWLFADQYGVVNALLELVGIDGPLWLGTVWGARTAVLIANVWLATPFVILILLAAMSSLSEDLYEAARLDGANAFQTFRTITLPLLKPAILMILVVRLSDAFRVFDIVYILTQSGPGGSTEVLSTYIYKNTFTGLQFGQGSAASFLVMLLIMIVSFVLFRLLRPREDRA
ncbi:ABC transporter permease [Paenibacillus darwinianus]|uniref:ABC transporter permease n=1 Tax=Paenibacillus darwinianus TaxID=1380763 RepID=A0A9W5S0Y0_9BACL|nr:sugar ABC transporter permease [Paenibacillus darwinianus]EXX84952.1 ABC transporter permease [Paenibacillus darwinianus]EXX86086.1 ABC transporter permease [Paenibacillus darwinianus]EXX87256.1 ABC transporter permease [Paenibacillus darwinianus]